MAAEREAFGFYFSAHPIDHHRHLLAAHRVRSYAELGHIQVNEGTRSAAMMAGLVEGVRWRVSARGRRYMMATLSDPSGQFEATVFEDEACADIEAAAKAGSCGLLTVELDRRPGDDQPRVAIRRFQPLEKLAKASRLQLELKLADAGVMPLIAGELEQARGGNGIVRCVVPISHGRDAVVLVGRDYRLDAEVAARLERIAGEGSVSLSVQEPPKLALVG
jgi:DNA polymerase-3 subunit alpha